jgi:hypothetical protein
MDRLAALRSSALSLEKNFSMGLKSGEYRLSLMRGIVKTFFNWSSRTLSVYELTFHKRTTHNLYRKERPHSRCSAWRSNQILFMTGSSNLQP